MMKKNKIFLITTLFLNILFSASGEFSGWGNAILHHVADSKSIPFYGLSISKHIVMLLISAFVTLMLSLLATQK